MTEINDIDELSEYISPMNSKLIEKYQQKNPSLMYKYDKGIYKPVILI